MGNTSIGWTEKSWNPIAAYFEGKRGWMCSKPSAGCKNCYSERLNLRFGNGLLYTAENAAKVDWQLVNLDEPGKWRKPAKCFVESMGDLFHEALPDELIGRVWSKMLEYPQHTFQVLTKRASRMRELIGRFTEEAKRKGLRSADHIWLGVSVENQEQADKRILQLLSTPAAVRFLSCEPLLGPINLTALSYFDEFVTPDNPAVLNAFTDRVHHPLTVHVGPTAEANPDGINWVIVGGESGPNFRPFDLAWARSLQQQCEAAGVAFHFKQHGGRTPDAGGCLLDGKEYKAYPKAA